MAKNFQITQYELPLAVNGFVQLASGKKVRIRRVHLEEDPAALVHEQGMRASNYSLVDYNRSGIPLVEIVTEPDLSNPAEAREFMDALLNILNYLGVFVQGVGVMKADANISLEGSERVEVKNISSFRDIEKALEFEAARQKAVLDRGEKVKKETRGFIVENDTTASLRSKESEDDYGYITEPDLSKIVVDDKWLVELKKRLPELPEQKAKRFEKEFKIAATDAKVLCSNLVLSRLFEEVAQTVKAELAARWLSRELLAIVNYDNHDLAELKLQASAIAELLELLQDGKVSEKNAKLAAIKYVNEKIVPTEFLKKNNLLSDLNQDAVILAVEKVLAENNKAFEELKSGNKKSLNFLVGLVMRQTQGKADARSVQKLIEEKIEKK
jgi:aspartyl-tRNA(Asn)/glutamyl-tRNA(Gln) amidotransferase subunit B